MGKHKNDIPEKIQCSSGWNYDARYFYIGT